MKVCLCILIAILSSCTNKSTSPKDKSAANTIKNNVISIPDALTSDRIPDQILYDFKYVELKEYSKKENIYSSKTVKIVNDHIYVFDDMVNILYCFNLNGVVDYHIDFSKFTTAKGKCIKADSFFVGNGKVYIIDTEKRLLITFDRNQMIKTKEFPFWATETERISNNDLIIFQGYVNDLFGSPHYFLRTDSNFVIKNKHRAIPNTELEASLKIGTTPNHIFRSDKITNLLLDQENSIYKYPDFVTPAYKVDFGNYNINLLQALSLDLPSPGLYRYARIKTVWENTNSVIFSYNFQKKPGYIIYNKKNKKIYNIYPIETLTDMPLGTILGVHNDHFYTIIENQQLAELSKLENKNQGFMKTYLKHRKQTGSNPVLFFFKLRNL